MTTSTIHVARTQTLLKPDQSRVLLRPFNPGDEERTSGIIARILSLPEDVACSLLKVVVAEFSQRHQHLRRLLLERFEQVRQLMPAGAKASERRRLLIGAYFLAEYSLE